jgi:DNA gyrase subunit B
MNRYRIRKAAKEIVVKVKRTGKKLKGRDLSILLEKMLEFDDYYRRLPGKLIDRKLVDTLLETMIGSNGLIQKDGPQLPDIFADEGLLGTVQAALSEAGYKADLISDEESGLSAFEVQNVSNGGDVLIDRKLFTQIEFQQAVDLYQSFIQPITPQFLVTEGKSETEIKSRGDLLIYVLTMANKNLAIQRFKNLSEMNPEQVWESVMNPEKRSLLQVTIGDVVKNDIVITPPNPQS